MNAFPHPSDEWLVEHGRFLRRLAGALLGDQASGDDAAQEAWLAALQSQAPERPAGWLTTVTRRLAWRSDRDAGRRRAREQAAARDERVPDAYSIAARAEIVRLVGEVVSDLPEPFRATLLLRFWEGLPPRLIAERLGIPVATVQSRTRRGLERVRAELERRAPSEERWDESLALAAGLLRPREWAGTSTVTATLGVAMKTKSWIASACALLIATTIGAIGISALRSAGPEESRRTASLVEPTGPASAPPLADSPVPSAVPVAASEDPPLARRAVVAAPVELVPVLVVSVLDAADRPVPGAELLGGPDAGALRFVARTSDEGRARLERTPELESEIRVLCARAAGWTPSPVYELEPRANEPDAEPETSLVMRLPFRGATLAVHVRDPRGAPLPDARVFAGREEEVDYRLPDGTLARTAPGFLRTTDAGGVADFPGLTPGWLRVFVEHDGYAATTSFTTLELDGDNRVDVTLAPGFVVFGRVLDERGAAVEGARVQRETSPSHTGVGSVAVSARDGSYRLGPVREGKITVLGPEGRRVRERVRGEPGEEVRWDPVLPSSPAVRGRVVDPRGAPLAGWFVHANFDTWPGWRSGTTTGEDGRFVVYDPPEGALRIEVRDEEEAALPVLSREGIRAGPDELTLEVPSDPWTRVVGGVERSGDEGGALPLFLRHTTTPGRQRLTGGPGRAVALDADGTFDLDVPVGSYELVVEGEPYGWFRLARFDARAKRTNDVGMLELPAPGTVRATTWWGGPEPTGDASYLLERRADQVTVLSLRGTFPEALSLAPGTYTLQTEVTPGPQREFEFEVRSGRVTEIQLDLTATCRQLVRVGYASGRTPSGSVSVQVRRLDDGAQIFSGMAGEVEAGEWGVDVELGSGRFEFTARDEAGREARTVENLYTPQPDREIRILFDDAD